MQLKTPELEAKKLNQGHIFKGYFEHTLSLNPSSYFRRLFSKHIIPNSMKIHKEVPKPRTHEIMKPKLKYSKAIFKTYYP